MSRVSIASYLSKAKQNLQRSLSGNGEHPAAFVIGNESADLDSIACALVYGYIHSNIAANRKANKCIIPVTNIPASQLRLRPELTALLKSANLKPSDLVTLDDLGKLHNALQPHITEWTLVDHNVFKGALGEHYQSRVTGVIDHHEDEGKVPEGARPRIIEKSGSCSSHVVNFCADELDSMFLSPAGQNDDSSSWVAQVAKLALGPILIDTVNFAAEDKVTDHDRKAVKYLEAKINEASKNATTFDRGAFFKDINDAKSDLDGLTIEEILEKDYKAWTEGELTLGISCSVRSIRYLQAQDKDFVSVAVAFAKRRKLDLYAVMTAHNDNDSFERQLILLSVKDGEAASLADGFTNEKSGEFQLQDSATELGKVDTPWLKLWEQKNLTASRKQIAPALREVMSKR